MSMPPKNAGPAKSKRSKRYQQRDARKRVSKLTFETLEAKRLLAGVTVGNALDISNGDTSSIAALIAPGGDGGDGISLREAITASNNTTGADTIAFDSSLSGGTITLSGSQLALTDSVTIDANSLAAGITIDANRQSRIFNLDSNGDRFTLRGLTLTNGTAGSGSGAAINVLAGELVLEESTLSGNSTSLGGGIFNDNSGTATITNSTLSGNSADRGGGILNLGTATITNSTLSDNFGVTGGGISNYGTATITNSIVANNQGSDDIGGSGSFGGSHNLIGDGSRLSDFTDSIEGDPMLGPLADNGGPTLTHALLSGSPAIDAGSNALAVDADGIPLLTDQRGAEFDRIFSSTVDIGAVEATPVTIPAQGLVVSTDADVFDFDFSPSQLSLREAVLLANEIAGPDTITFDSSLSGGTITLSGTELELIDSVTIDANSLAAGLTIDGNDQSRIFNLDSTGDRFTLRGLTLTNGNAGFSSGGAIFVRAGELVLEDSTLTGNSGGFGGGGIFNLGTATITNSTLTGNTSVGEGGGGGITNRGRATITNSTLSGNSANAYGGGISNYGTATITITNSTLSNNSVAGRGGGFLNGIDGTATITNSTLSGNSASYGGGIDNSGTATITNSTLSGNSASAYGGGISNSYGTATITIANSTLSGNSAGGGFFSEGGGIFNYNGGTATITGSTLSGNSAEYGAGISSRGTITITNSTLSGNSAGRYGGGILNGGTVTITNSTLSGNSTTATFSNGGGIDNFGTATITGSTLSDNSARSGGGIFNRGTTTITNSIVANSQGGNDLRALFSTSFDGSHNLIGDGSRLSDFTDSIEGDPTLGPLADNGGPTLTHALLPGSPAIDTGNNALAVDANSDPLTTDQRGIGFDRIFSGTVDIGAFEFDPTFLLGDVDQNGAVNFLDISPFIRLLSSRGFQAEADIDGNGVVNFLDISPFIRILSGGNSSSLSAFSQFSGSSPTASLLASEADVPQSTTFSGGSRQISDGISIELKAPTQLSIEPDEIASVPASSFEQASVQPTEIARAESTQSSESISAPSQQASDATSIELAAAPPSLSLPPSAVAVADLIASPSRPSLLAFIGIGAGEVNGRGDSSASQNEIPVLANKLSKRTSDEDQAISLAQQESVSNSDHADVSLLDDDLGFTLGKSSADLFDAHPELLEGITDAQLDGVFEELLI